MKGRAPRLACLALLAACTSACLSATWRRDVRYGAPPDGALGSLQPGASDLAACLARLGAPLEVWENPGGGMALAWGWQRERDLGLTLSVPVDSGLSATLNVVDQRARLRGAVLFFDEQGTLVLVRKGLLGELRPGPRRPAAIDEPE